MAREQHRHRRRESGASIISLDEHRRRRPAARAERLSPEHDGLELLYANDRHPDTLFALGILAWARMSDGRVTALVPWLNALMPAEELVDPLNGHWEGYRLPEADTLFTEAPEHKVRELDEAAAFFGSGRDEELIQEIPDTLGTHAVFADEQFVEISLLPLTSWRLYADGSIRAMVAEPEQVTTTPVLPGDPCLVFAEERPDFRYFFQHGIANKLKNQDPEALAALSMLAAEP